tara:strand:+ start:1116 stop:1664 length:549 start_codon:yes stop_codon:yes gene_type:complete
MFPKLEETEITSNSNTQSSYLRAGAHRVTIKSFKTSDENAGYQGTPYFEFIVENTEGVAFLKFNGIDSHTSEAAARVRTSIFKSFLIAAGATTYTDPQMAANSIIGNAFEVCLASREYWTTDKDTNLPVIKSRTEYKFANPSGQKITFKESFNKVLSPEDRAAYEAAVSLTTNNTSQVNTPF